MQTNADITLYNRVIDRDDGVSRWERTAIRGVNWQDRQNVTMDEKGLKSADSTKIFIPIGADCSGKEYIEPKAYQRMSDREGAFTFENGDIVVKGIVDAQIGTTKSDNLAAFMRRHDHAMTIVSVADRRYGSRPLRHFELGVK